MAAIDEWGSSDHSGGNAGEHLGVAEHLGDEHEGGEFEFDGGHESDAASVVGAPQSSSEDEALAAKRAKDKKIMKIGGVIVGCIALAVVGSVFLGGGQQPQMEPPPVVRPLPPPVQPVVGATVQDAPQGTAAAPSALAASSPTAPASAPDTVQTAQVRQVVGATAQLQPSTAQPVALVPTQGVSAPSLLQPALDKSKAVIDDLKSQIDGLQGQIKSLKEELAQKDKQLEALRTQRQQVAHAAVSSTAKPATTPSPKPTEPKEVVISSKTATPASKKAAANATDPDKGSADAAQNARPVVNEPLVVKETKQTPVVAPAAQKGGRVRNEFTVYAISNGRAWVTWSKDALNYTVGVNSELPDYSRVTSIDDVAGIVYTTTGEIHAKPPTK